MINQNLQSHEFLAIENKHFLEYVKRNPKYLEKENFIDIKEGHCFSELNLNPWPTFISKSTDDYFHSVTIQIFNLFKSIPSNFFNNDLYKMSEYYKFPIDQLELLFWSLPDNQFENLIGRADFILDLDNELKCIEYNISAFLGGWQIDFLSKRYQNSKNIKDYLQCKEFNVKEYNFFSNCLNILKAQ